MPVPPAPPASQTPPVSQPPPASQTPLPPPTAPPSEGPQITALAGNRAALTLLVVQNVVSALCLGVWVPVGGRDVQLGLGLPLGTSLLISFAVTVLVALTAFKVPVRALLADSRWRTPPAWGLAAAAFVLGFLTSRAFVLAYVLLVPSAAGSVPEFRSQGWDVLPLLLAAGLLIPFVEEVAFRGLMMRGQERAAGFGVAAVASTLAFSLAHGVPASIVGIVPLAYVLARLVQHSGSLWNAVIVHALNNTLAVGLGIFLLGQSKVRPESTDLLQNEALRLPLALGALLFGVAVLVVLHLWLVPRPDPQERRAPGPWVSAAYVVIVLFGLLMVVQSLPFVQRLLSTPQGVMQ